MKEEEKTRKQINNILRECILSDKDKESVKLLFTELMQDKVAWDKFLNIVIPSVKKDLDVVSDEQFEEFKKITFEEIEKYKP